MAQITNTYSQYDAIGEREDLSDIIYSISPTDTPFMSNIGKTKATGVHHEWQTDALAAAAANNFQIEGDEVAFNAMVPTARIGNKSQISRKSVIVSGTLESVSKAVEIMKWLTKFLKLQKSLKEIWKLLYY